MSQFYPNLSLIFCHKDIHMIIGPLQSSDRVQGELSCAQPCLIEDKHTDYNENKELEAEECQKACYLKGIVSSIS